MPASKTKIVKIERGKYSPYFQVARAWITAASALVSVDAREAVAYLDAAIKELIALRTELAGGLK